MLPLEKRPEFISAITNVSEQDKYQFNHHYFALSEKYRPTYLALTDEQKEIYADGEEDQKESLIKFIYN